MIYKLFYIFFIFALTLNSYSKDLSLELKPVINLSLAKNKPLLKEYVGPLFWLFK